MLKAPHYQLTSNHCFSRFSVIQIIAWRIGKKGNSCYRPLEQYKLTDTDLHIIRMSPSGFRFVTCSYKGTVIRLFSSLNGSLLTSFSMSDHSAKLNYIDFLPNGNAIVCLNDNRQINFFHTCRTESELWSETTKH